METCKILKTCELVEKIKRFMIISMAKSHPLFVVVVFFFKNSFQQHIPWLHLNFILRYANKWLFGCYLCTRSNLAQVLLLPLVVFRLYFLLRNILPTWSRIQDILAQIIKKLNSCKQTKTGIDRIIFSWGQIELLRVKSLRNDLFWRHTAWLTKRLLKKRQKENSPGFTIRWMQKVKFLKRIKARANTDWLLQQRIKKNTNITQER